MTSPLGWPSGARIGGSGYLLLMVILFSLLACRPAPTETASPADTDTGAESNDTATPAAPAASLVETMPSLFSVRWQQPDPATARVEYWLDDAWQSTPAHTLAPGAAEITAAGLPFQTTAAWRLLVDDEVTAEGTITTGDPPEFTPVPIILSSIPEQHAPELRYLIASISSSGYDEPVWTVIVDRKGRLLWSQRTPEDRVTLHPRLSHDGHSILIDHNSFWGDLDEGVNSTVVRVGLDGVVQETIATPGLHHPFVELSDGSLAWGAASGKHEDIVIRPPGGEAEVLWRCADLYKDLGIEAECRSNTLWTDADEQRFLLSLFTTETVIEVDRGTGAATRWFGHLDGSWAFADESDAFYWQHGAQYTPDGTLLVSAKTGPKVEETVIREYALDEEGEVLTQVWSFGLGDGIYGPQMGEPWQLSDGHILHNYGSLPRIREANAEGEVVWDIGWAGFHFLGRSTPLEELYSLLP